MNDDPQSHRRPGRLHLLRLSNRPAARRRLHLLGPAIGKRASPVNRWTPSSVAINLPISRSSEAGSSWADPASETYAVIIDVGSHQRGPHFLAY